MVLRGRRRRRRRRRTVRRRRGRGPRRRGATRPQIVRRRNARFAARQRRRNRYHHNYVYVGVRPAYRGYWRSPRYVGGAYAARPPPTVVVPYQAPATVIIDNRNAGPGQMAQAPYPQDTNSLQTQQLVEQKYTRVKFFNKEIMGFELNGAVVTDVDPGGPADDGGVEEGFHVIALNDVQQKPGTLMDSLHSAVKPYVIDFCYVPEGWEAIWSEESKRFYFADHASQKTSWNLPPIPMSKTAVDDAESTQTGRGEDGIFTVKCEVTFFPQDTEQQPTVSEGKEPGALGIKVSKTTTNVESLIQLVEDVQDELLGDADYEIDYTSAYSKKGKLDDNAMLVNCIDIDGETLEVCGHKQPREEEPVASCCTIL